jgi:hypothetical protein
VAASIDGFVGFAIGRSIWEEPIVGHNRGNADSEQAFSQIAMRYLDFARRYCTASGAAVAADADPSLDLDQGRVGSPGAVCQRASSPPYAGSCPP